MVNGSESNPLSPMDVSTRSVKLRQALTEAGCDALVVTKLCNIRYLTGFSGSAAMLLVRADDLVFLTDGRYREQSAAQLAAAGVECEIVVGRHSEQLEALDRAVAGIKRVGLEAEEVSWATKRRLAADLDAFKSGSSSLVATSGLVETLRRVKDEGEVARIERAADIADVALAQVKERLREGLTEAEFGLELDFEMRRRGAHDVSFETIVASGPNGALPHARPEDRRIEEGDVVVLDFGAEVEGYHSDMTRTLSVGPPASSQLTDLIDAVLVAQRAGVRTLKTGAVAAEVDKACRNSLGEAGYGELFVHPTGHGVGLEIHEAPAVWEKSPDILDEGVVVTVEPGAYLPGVGGVRIEDTLLVTAAGARALTKSTKDTIL